MTMTRTMKLPTRLGVLAFLLLCVMHPASFVNGQENNPPELGASAAEYFDNLIPARLASDHIAGAVVTVVQGDQVIFSRGYGMADVEFGRAVDPETTLFRLASVSKLFTATAVMQLVEQGLIDLNADVNTYLDFYIPDTFAQPITVIDLLNHTAGFEDWYIGSRQRPDLPFPSLHAVLISNVPERVYPPGTVTAYSNYGMALAGYIVERVSGMSYPDYVQERIFAPLDMAHSTAVQPIPVPLSADAALNYVVRENTFIAQPFEVVLTTPSGGLSASAGDMARFMIAHLNGGRSANARILEPGTVAQMQTRSFSNDPRVNGVAHGFWERRMFGQTILEHGGDLMATATSLTLLPEHRVGLFIAINQHGRAVEELRRSAWTGFIGDFFSSGFIAPQTNEPGGTPVESLAGHYVTTRRALSTPDKLGALFGMIQTLTITTEPDGSLLVDGNRYVEAAPLTYRWSEDPGYGAVIVFRELDGGGYQVMANNLPSLAFRPMPWYETPIVNFALLGFVAVVCLLTLIVGIAALVRHRIDGVSSTACAVCLLMVLIIVALGVVLSDPAAAGAGLPPLFYAAAALTLVLVATLLLFATLMLTRGMAKGTRFALRLHYGLVLVAGISFVLFLHTWNLLGFRL